MDKKTFIDNVKQVMNDADLYNDIDVSLIGADTTLLDYHIDKVYVDAWKSLYNRKTETGMYIVPRELFEKKDFKDAELYSFIHTGDGYVILPSDYYDIHTFRMEGWSVPVTEALDIDHYLYSRQSNEFAKGKWIRPLCFESSKNIKDESTGSYKVRKVLEYYSLPKGEEHKILTAIYFPVIKPLEQGVVGQDSELVRGLVFLCGSLIYAIQQRLELSNVLEGIAYKTLNR